MYIDVGNHFPNTIKNMVKVGNFDYGNMYFEKFIIENGNIEFSNSEIGYRPPWGGVGGGGVTADDDRGCYDPVGPPV
jgi:hypothetical protein